MTIFKNSVFLYLADNLILSNIKMGPFSHINQIRLFVEFKKRIERRKKIEKKNVARLQDSTEIVNLLGPRCVHLEILCQRI